YRPPRHRSGAGRRGAAGGGDPPGGDGGAIRMAAAAIGCRPPGPARLGSLMATFASAPVLVVTDVAARLVRRGLLAPADAARGGWRRARLLVFRRGPVVVERPAATWHLGDAL